MKTRNGSSWLWLGGTALVGVALTRWQMARWFTEQPRYVRERTFPPLEIRRYTPHWVAETSVESSWEGALEEGFRRLAAYIFGNNRFESKRLGSDAARTSADEPTEHANGTEGAESVEIAMTSPVQMQRSAPLSELSAPALRTMSHIVTFHLPRGRTAANLPTPNDERVRLTLKPEARVAVLRYRGRHDAETMASRSLELLVALRRAGLRYRSNPQFAGYDAPSTLPLLRRNEVWVELEAS
jgi:SOUL heme-binding protein